MPSTNDFFETSDLNLANTLYYFGAKLEAIDKKDPSRAVFVFKRETGLDNIIQGYWSHTPEIKVDPLKFFNCLRELKTRLRQQVG